MARVVLEPIEGRPAWEVRVDGRRVGLLWRERKYFRGVAEGTDTPLPTQFNSRDAAARALARKAGVEDLGEVTVADDRKGKA